MTAVASPKTAYFDAIYETLPHTLKECVDVLFAKHASNGETRHTFDRLLRFSLGGNHPEGDAVSPTEWNDAQSKLETALSSLDESYSNGKKRGRDDDHHSSGQTSKKAKLESTVTLLNGDQEDSPIYSLHAFSVISPVRKKVDITIHQRSIRFTNTTSGSLESVIPTESLTRAFLLSTPGKTKQHWTIIILSNTEQNQIIYGVDGVPPSLKTTVHPHAPETSPKGTSVEASLRTFLSHLPSHIPLLEPSTSQFRSGTGEPWLDTYLRAKEGHLFFFKNGILFGIKKPCIWIGMEEIEGVRSLSATGRTLSIFIKRRPADDEDQTEEGEETEFSMVDGKHQDSVSQWIQDNHRLFGVDPEKQKLMEKEVHDTELAKADLDESDDSDYQSESDSDDGGEPTSDSDSNDEESIGESSGSEEEEEDGDGEAEDEEADNATEDEEEPLDPSKHPLMRPGAVPRLSKAAMDAVIGMVERDLKGDVVGKPQAVNNGQEIDELGDDEEDEIDQLE